MLLAPVFCRPDSFIHLQVRLPAPLRFSGARSQQIMFSIKIGTGGTLGTLGAMQDKLSGEDAAECRMLEV